MRDPEPPLRKLLRHFDLPWDDRVLKAHENYREGEIGHGGMRLWEPIHDRAGDKYKTLPRVEFDKIYAITAAAMDKFGYGIDAKHNLVVHEPFDDRFAL